MKTKNSKIRYPIISKIGYLRQNERASKINLNYLPSKTTPINQLILYALALSRKTNLKLKYFKCAWFDKNNYYEFYPLHAVYIKNQNKTEKYSYHNYIKNIQK